MVKPIYPFSNDIVFCVSLGEYPALTNSSLNDHKCAADLEYGPAKHVSPLLYKKRRNVYFLLSYLHGTARLFLSVLSCSCRSDADFHCRGIPVRYFSCPA